MTTSQRRRAPLVGAKPANIKLPVALIEQVAHLHRARRSEGIDVHKCVLYREILEEGLRYFDPATGRLKERQSLDLQVSGAVAVL
jgi:hypothetical protein